MTVANDQDGSQDRTVVTREPGSDQPVACAGMSAGIHHDAMLLSLVGHSSHRKIITWEVWA